MVTFEYRFDVLPGKLDEYEKYTQGAGKDIWLKFSGVQAVRVYKSMLGGSSPQRVVQVDLEILAALEKIKPVLNEAKPARNEPAGHQEAGEPGDDGGEGAEYDDGFDPTGVYSARLSLPAPAGAGIRFPDAPRRCSFCSSFSSSRFLSPLISSTLSSSTCTLMSPDFNPGMSIMKTYELGYSFTSAGVAAIALEHDARAPDRAAQADLPGPGHCGTVDGPPDLLDANPQTGEPIQIKAKTVVKFRVAKAAKDAILRERGAEVGRNHEEIERTVTVWLAIRDDETGAESRGIEPGIWTRRVASPALPSSSAGSSR